MRFIDTSFWFALRQRRDRNHESALAIFDQGLGATLVSNMVVGETWTLLRRRSGHDAALKFVDYLQRLPGLEIASIDERMEREAWRWLRQHNEREYSFVDATSFALMRRRRLQEALAFDGDFDAAGFVEVRP